MPDEKMEEFSEQNLSEGYCIKIKVLPGNQFTVSDRQPITDDDYNQLEVIDGLTDALKNIMAVIEANPLEGSESEGFEESESEPAGTQAY